MPPTFPTSFNFSNQISGIAAASITGYLVDARHSYVWAFGLPAIYLAIGIAAYVFLLGKIEPPAGSLQVSDGVS